MGWEFDALVEEMSTAPVPLASAPLPDAADVLSCPNLQDQPDYVLNAYSTTDYVKQLPYRESYWPNGSGDCGWPGYGGPWSDSAYNYILGYNYTGGSHFWLQRSGPTYSPRKVTDPPDWTLAADFMRYYSSWPTPWITAHMRRPGQPAGGNHLFHDGSVEWVPFNAGANFPQNVFWCHWKRRQDAP